MHVNNTLLTSVHFQRKAAHTWQQIHQNHDKPCERIGNVTWQCGGPVQILSSTLNIPQSLRLPTTDPSFSFFSKSCLPSHLAPLSSYITLGVHGWGKNN